MKVIDLGQLGVYCSMDDCNAKALGIHLFLDSIPKEYHYSEMESVYLDWVLNKAKETHEWNINHEIFLEELKVVSKEKYYDEACEEMLAVRFSDAGRNMSLKEQYDIAVKNLGLEVPVVSKPIESWSISNSHTWEQIRARHAFTGPGKAKQ